MIRKKYVPPSKNTLAKSLVNLHLTPKYSNQFKTQVLSEKEIRNALYAAKTNPKLFSTVVRELNILSKKGTILDKYTKGDILSGDLTYSIGPLVKAVVQEIRIKPKIDKLNQQIKSGKTIFAGKIIFDFNTLKPAITKSAIKIAFAKTVFNSTKRQQLINELLELEKQGVIVKHHEGDFGHLTDQFGKSISEYIKNKI